ncbi:MAG: OmpA family protein, partial [Bacteroidales bacterium]
MMHFKSLFAILILVVGFSFSLAAQKNYTEEADNAFTMRRYYEAVELYQKAYSDVTNKVERRRILFQIAECYRLTNNIRRAEFAYLRAIRTDYPDPKIYLRYATILMKREKYEDALEQFRKYKEEVPDDPRADIGIESCKMAPDWMENPTRYEVEANRRINDRNSDFAPMYADRNYKTVVFASTRSEATGKTDPNTGQRFSDLFIIERDERGNFSRAELLDDEGIINTGENVGAVDFDRRFTTMYFTKCPTERKEVLTCRIYSTRKRGRTWSEPEMLKLGPDTFTYGHPAVSSDERTIIFASDMDGGEGELDLWMATRRSANRPFGEPENLGPAINTHGNEMYPYLFDDNTLYFSSNGHVGMGGLDIFVSKKENGEWGEPENMKYPMNSPLDDFGITFNKNQRTLEENEAEQMGFLTTSRRGGRGSDNLWHFRLPEIVFTISGVVRNESNLQRMPGATVTMEGSDGTKVETKTDNTGRYNFNERQVNKNTSYELIASMEGFFDDTKKETTVGRETSADLVVDFRLKPIPDEPIPLPEIRFDLAKWDLKDKYKDSLNGLIKTLEKNPKLVIELAAHTDFRDTKEKNDTLSLRRAQSIVDYLVDEGIDRRRLRPRGYGERRPRKLRKELTVNGVSFEKGTHLTESYIKDLRTSREKEAAHQLNRRVTFEILRNDFVPSKDAVADIDTTGFGDIELNPEENILELKVTDNNYEMPVIVNRQQLN